MGGVMRILELVRDKQVLVETKGMPVWSKSLSQSGKIDKKHNENRVQVTSSNLWEAQMALSGGFDQAEERPNVLI